MSTHTFTSLVRVRQANAADLLAGVAATVAIDLFVWLVPMNTPVRTALALPLLVFLPGYFVLAVVFPRASTTDNRPPWNREATRIDLFERLALSYGLSLAILPLLALALTSLSLELTAGTILTSLTTIVLVCVPLTVGRRASVESAQRYELPVGRWLSGTVDAVRERPRKVRFVNGLLVLSIVVGLGVTAGAILAQPGHAEYTELAVLTENNQGQLVAGDYPTTVTAGESVPLILSVENRADRAADYAVIVQAQRLGPDGQVARRERVQSFSHTVGSGSEWRRPHDVTIPFEASRVRLTYLLYTGSPPPTPTRDNADRSVHIWLSSSD